MLGWVAMGGAACCLVAAPAEPAPDFGEVFGLLRTHLKGIDADALNKAAVEGLLDQLHPKVTLLPARDPDTPATPAPSLRKSLLFDGAFGYFQFGPLAGDAGARLREAFDQLNATHPLKGVILDLRFAGGTDYGAAVAVADWFFAGSQPLADWGSGMKHSAVKDNALALPLAILVNTKTAGAAEVLAGVLRQGGIGLLLGSRTAGQASQFAEFTLRNGQRLRLAVQPVKLGRGRPISASGLRPDIHVAVRLADESRFLEDAYAPAAAGAPASAAAAAAGTAASQATNAGSRRINEAELIRRHRENRGPDDEREAGQEAGEPDAPVLQDPVLARALDLLKGLAVIRVKPPQSSPRE